MKQDIVLSTSMLIDPTIEPLYQILPSYQGITHVPSELDGPALMVFIELQKCFQKSGRVCEGLLPNVYWGFKECGYDEKHVAAGLTKLRHLEYTYYSDAARNKMTEFSWDPKAQVWIRYTEKFKRLFCQQNGSGLIFQGNS